MPRLEGIEVHWEQRPGHATCSLAAECIPADYKPDFLGSAVGTLEDNPGQRGDELAHDAFGAKP